MNVDEIVLPTMGWAGFTVRTFDLERAEVTPLTPRAEATDLAPQPNGGGMRDIYDSKTERIVLTSSACGADGWRAFSTIEPARSTFPGEGP